MDKSSALLVVSFGTSYEETRKVTIDAIEEDLRRAFPQRKFYRAWTSRRIVEKLRKTRDICYDSVKEAMERMLGEGITDVLIQPTHMMPGLEFENTKNTILSYRDRFEKIRMGAPLLEGQKDVKALAGVLEEIFREVDPTRMLAFMGHGSARSEFPAYTLLEKQFAEDGFDHFCVGTVEFEPGIEPVLRRIRERKPEKVYLTPLLVVAGDHALNDMAGEEEDSWKSQVAREGAEPVCIVKGMGEYREVREIYVEHAGRAKQV